METVALNAVPITLGQEEDRRCWANIESMPGVMSYGASRDAAIANIPSLAFRVAADCIDHGEEVPEALAKIFCVV